MKNFVILFAALASLNTFASRLDCSKAGSKITLSKTDVIIEAEDVPMTDDLLAMARRSFGPEAEGVSIGIKLSFPKKDLKCSDGTSTVTSCSGKTKKASVSLNISQRSIYGSASAELTRRPVKLENIDISSLTSLDQVSVKSSMVVKMNGDFQLDLEQAFNASTECR